MRPIGVQEAIASALRNEDSAFAQTRWSDALSAAGEPSQWGGTRFGNRLVDSRALPVGLRHQRCLTRWSVSVARRVGITRTGFGLYAAGWICSWAEWGCGGAGLDPLRVRVGDVLDCWRVENIEPGQRLRLAAEMRLPGRAWLEFDVKPLGAGSELRQTATFDPLGFLGLAYWYAVWPLHQFVFAGMLRGIAVAAEKSVETGSRLK